MRRPARPVRYQHTEAPPPPGRWHRSGDRPRAPRISRTPQVEEQHHLDDDDLKRRGIVPGRPDEGPPEQHRQVRPDEGHSRHHPQQGNQVALRDPGRHGARVRIGAKAVLFLNAMTDMANPFEVGGGPIDRQEHAPVVLEDLPPRPQRHEIEARRALVAAGPCRRTAAGGLPFRAGASAGCRAARSAGRPCRPGCWSPRCSRSSPGRRRSPPCRSRR